jgi:hypothetical protein
MCVQVDLARLRLVVAENSIQRERFISPRNWTIMHHLLEHMPQEVGKFGPVRELGMFAFESMFGHLKGLVKNRALPVANIMKSWMMTKSVVLARAAINHHVQRLQYGELRMPELVPPSPETKATRRVVLLGPNPLRKRRQVSINHLNLNIAILVSDMADGVRTANAGNL